MGDGADYLREELYRRVREEPQIFDFLQDGSLDGIWYWDIEQPEHEWMSPRLKQVFGYRDDEVANTPQWWQDNIHPGDLAVALDNFTKHCEDPSHAYDQIGTDQIGGLELHSYAPLRPAACRGRTMM